nr:DUF3142 domain-containing protein [Klebsiella variicola]
MAFPAYGSALISSSGKPASVESESPLWIAAEKQELSVSPQQIDTFIRELEQDPPKNFQVSSGFVCRWITIPAPGRLVRWRQSFTTRRLWLAFPDKASIHW